MNAGYILVVDDEPDIRRLIREILEDEHYQVQTAENAAAARELYRKQRPDLVLLDIWMPDADGITLLREWAHAGALETPVVMISGHGTVETAVEATRLGAYDFIEKPVSMGKLLVTVERALESEKLKRENLRLKREVEPATFLTGKSPAIRELREAIERVAATDSWVVISGEPGSGKAVAARYLHSHSARRAQPLVEVSLGAIPPQNVATQLFGSEQEGVATPGALEQAHGGTLLLNEVGDLEPNAQTQLLRALEKMRFLRIGGRETVGVNVRIVATTSTDLAAAVADNRFREDLYYRLNVVPIHIPPLREHREDAPELVGFYVDWMVDHEHLTYRKFTTGALNALRNYSWPGNIRELKNIVQRLLIFNRGPEVSAAEVEEALGSQARTLVPSDIPAPLFEQPLRAARDQFEKAYLEHHLQKTGGNVAEVARVSEMERTNLYRKLKQLGITPKPGKE